MKRKRIGTILLIVGAVLVAISALGLFQAIQSYLIENSYVVSMSGSMEPTFKSGDVLKVKLGVNAHEIYAAPKWANPPGDIIVFRKPTDPSELIVHRAVGNGTDISYYLITEGDANPGPDMWSVRETDLIGKVVEINPPFWTYNFVFWIIILGIGAVFVAVGVVVRQREPGK